MIDVIKVHQLPAILGRPDDLRAEHLRTLIRAAGAHAVVEDAQTGQRYRATLVGRRIELAPIASPPAAVEPPAAAAS